MIFVRTQQELDAIPAGTTDEICIQFGTIRKPAIVSKKNYTTPIKVQGKFCLTAFECSRVIACDESFVEAKDKSYVEAKGNSRVIAYDQSSVRAYQNSNVELYDKSGACAIQNSVVTIYGSGEVYAEGAEGSSVQVKAYADSRVLARDHVKLTPPTPHGVGFLSTFFSLIHQ